MADWQTAAAKVAANGGPLIGQVIGAALAGPAGGAAGNMVGNVFGGLLSQALGVPFDPTAISDAIDKDPVGAAAKIQAVEAAHKTALELAADDLVNARAQTVELAKAGSGIAWGAPVISVITVVGFVAVALYALIHGVNDSQATLMVLGALISGFSQVIGYWLGSSFGSTQKDATLAGIIRPLSSAIRKV